MKDEQGKVVKSKLDDTRLREIAQAADGFYLHLDNGPKTMQQLFTDGLSKMKVADINARLSRRPIERYEWPLAAAILLFAIALLINDRKRGNAVPVAPVAAALLLLILVRPSYGAADGIDLYEQQKFPEAYEHFQETLKENPGTRQTDRIEFDSGAASYKMKDYNKAMQSFSQALLSKDAHLEAASHYNLGNTLYQRGDAEKSDDKKLTDWEGALQHYTETLKAEPKNREAKDNYDYVKKKIDELKKKQEQTPTPTPTPTPSPSPSPQKNDQKKNDQDKDQDKDKGQGQGQGDQKNKDQQKGGKQQQSKGGQGSKDQQQQKGEQGRQSPTPTPTPSPSPSGTASPSPTPTPSPTPGSSPSPGAGSPTPTPTPSPEGQGGSSPSPSPGEGESPSPTPGEQGSPTPGEQGSPTPTPGSGDQNGGEGASPTPAGTPGKPLTGDVKGANGEQPKEKKPAQEAEAEPDKEGEMSPKQAARLLESMKDEEQKVQLDEHKATRHVYKDW